MAATRPTATHSSPPPTATAQTPTTLAPDCGVSTTRPRSPSGTVDPSGPTEQPSPASDSDNQRQRPLVGDQRAHATSRPLADPPVSATRPRGVPEAETGRAQPRPDRESSLTDQIEVVVETLARSQYELVTLAAEFADSPEWILTGSPTAAHWLAIVADVEPCTAREWIRIGRLLQTLPTIADAFRNREISYSKVRALTRLATPENEHELLTIAMATTAADLGRALAAWFNANSEPEDVEAYHRRQRSVKWRTEPDGMVLVSLRLPPMIAALLISFLTIWVMRSRPKPVAGEAWPSVAQQHADAVEALLKEGAGNIDTEVVVHVNGDGSALADGTPIADSVVAKLIPESFISALVHDSAGNPIDATNRRRHPTRRQRRLVDARDQCCVDCGRTELLQYDHVPAHEQSGHTVTTELRRRCAPCHQQRHAPRHR